MTKEERLARLKALRKPKILEAFSTREEFVDWQAEVAPLLNFNQLYYSNFVAAADVASHPNLSSYTINPSLARLDMLMKQAIAELVEWFPGVKREDAFAVLAFAEKSLATM